MNEVQNNTSTSKAPFISKNDIPRIFASSAVFGACLAYGSNFNALGAVLPEISREIGVESSVVGQLFVWRGIGFLIGTFWAAYLMNIGCYGFSKHFTCTVCIILSSIPTALIPIATRAKPSTALKLSIILFLIQGIGYGALDTISIVSFQEMWGQRVQPWMQSKNLMTRIGGIIGPVCVNKYGFDLAFEITAILGVTALIGNILEFSYTRIQDENPCDRFSCWKVRANDHVAEELTILKTNLQVIQDEAAADDVRSETIGTILGSLDVRTIGGTVATFPAYSKVLSFATSEIVDLLEENFVEVTDLRLVPTHVSIVLAVFLFFQIGLYVSFSGWISTYTLMVDPNLTFQDGAYVTSIYGLFMFIGSVISIPLSLYLSATVLMRFELVVLFLGAVSMFLPIDPSLQGTVASILIGLSMSFIYPLTMTLANDYNMTMDGDSIFYLVLGGSLGESVIPMLIGILVKYFGPAAFPLSVAVTAVIMIVTYIYVHFTLQKYYFPLSDNVCSPLGINTAEEKEPPPPEMSSLLYLTSPPPYNDSPFNPANRKRIFSPMKRSISPRKQSLRLLPPRHVEMLKHYGSIGSESDFPLVKLDSVEEEIPMRRSLSESDTELF